MVIIAQVGHLVRKISSGHYQRLIVDNDTRDIRRPIPKLARRPSRVRFYLMFFFSTRWRWSRNAATSRDVVTFGISRFCDRASTRPLIFSSTTSPDVQDLTTYLSLCVSADYFRQNTALTRCLVPGSIGASRHPGHLTAIWEHQHTIPEPGPLSTIHSRHHPTRRNRRHILGVNHEPLSWRLGGKPGSQPP